MDPCPHFTKKFIPEKLRSNFKRKPAWTCAQNMNLMILRRIRWLQCWWSILVGVPVMSDCQAVSCCDAHQHVVSSLSNVLQNLKFSGRYSVHLYLQKRSSLRFHGSWPPVQIFWMSYFILYCFYRVDTTFYCWIINRFTIFSEIWFSTCFPDSLGEINKNVPFCCLRKIQWPPTVSESWVQSALPPLLLCTWTHIHIRKPHNLWART